MAGISVFDIVGSEVFEAIDRLGYDFLEKNGYDTRKARRYSDGRKRLARRLKADRFELTLRHKISDRGRTVYFWYVLKQRGLEVAKSDTLVIREKGELKDEQ